MKFHMKRTPKNINVTYEEFLTLLTQIECILNSRPLFAKSEDPSDLEPITPSHFLTLRPLVSIPEPNLLPIPVNRLSRFQHVQQLHQRFWNRFSKEYISQLHQSYKWHHNSTNNIVPGSLVIIRDTNLPPCRWIMGRIIKLFPGKDGENRVAEIKTSNGLITRSTRHLFPLPIED
ncbi:uncharacterized protein [Diabrotica undecimpunctata]|uniref:uncharacterized protein n=1 Tax=Diabrotica undecimpunctata TaxID=50387 RepID=UPI003B63B021